MTTEKIIKGLATLVIVAAVLAVVGYLWHIVVYVAAAAVLAILGRPLVRIITRLKLFGRNLSRGVAAALTLGVIWIVVGLLLTLFFPLVFNKLYELSTLDWEHITMVVRQAFVNVEQYIELRLPVDVPSLEVVFKDGVFSLFSAGLFTNVASYFVSAAVAFFSISFITFFFMREDGLFYRGVALFFPDNYHQNVFRALDSITMLLKRYFGGLVVESLVLTAVIALVLSLFGMRINDAWVLGLIVGVLNVVPYAGPFIGSIIAVAMSMLTPIDGAMMYTVIVVFSTIVVVKVIDDFVIQPTLYSERVQAHPLEVFLVILIAGFIGGVWGMLLAIPLYTILRVFAREFFSEYSIVRKLTNQMTK
ncbi:MAG: AI-2E family transporter [Alistipes sp.]|nr:AI-2E family transporter [Alistipes sp.]